VLIIASYDDHTGKALTLANRFDGLSALRPVTPPRKLTLEIAARLADDILSGKLAPGARLPTEQEMVGAMGVSRTVVREAVAALRADGLVVTRQGVGAFVASDPSRRPFRLTAAELSTLQDVLDVMALRASVEVEAAGLAAERASRGARTRIGKALAAIDQAIARDDSAVDEDFAFHRAIAEATGNVQFRRFLEYLGRFIIPRQSVRAAAQLAGGQRAYLERIQREHRAIHAAISAGDATRAREAMRSHLVNSQQRYRQLAAEAKRRAKP